MMLVGGPVGATVLLVAGMALLINSMKTADEVTNTYRDSISDLEKTELKALIAQQERTAASIQATIDRTENQNQSIEANKKALQAQKDRLEEVTETIRLAREALDGQTEAVETATGVTQTMGTELDTAAKYIFTMKTGIVEVADEATTTAGVVKYFNEIIEASGTASKDAAKAQAEAWDAMVEDAIAATDTLIADKERQKELDKAGWDAMVAESVAATDAMIAESEKIAESQTRILEDVFGDMRKAVASDFEAMLSSGKISFGGLADAFKSMILKMVADWAASNIMGMIGKIAGIGGLQVGGQFNPVSAVGSLLSGGKALGALGTAASTASAGAGYVGLMASSGATIPGAAGGAAATGGGLLSGAGGAISSGVSAVGGGISSAVSAIPGWGWALGGAALVAKLLDSGGTMSANAGFLTHDVPGAKADQKFSVSAFDSGISPVGFARRESQDNARNVIEAFRAVDSGIVDLFAAAGKTLTVTGKEIGGFDEHGNPEGAFDGSDSEDGSARGTDMEGQLTAYARYLLSAAAGKGLIDNDRYTRLINSGNYADILDLGSKMIATIPQAATGIESIPYDNFLLNTHKDEAVQNRGDNKKLEMLDRRAHV